MKNLISFDEAKKIILNQLIPIVESVKVPLTEAIGRISAASIYSPIAIPIFDNSAVDGYAIRFNDCTTQALLPIAGYSCAGKPFLGPWPHNSVIRIMTGAPLPLGSEAIVMQEDVKIFSGGIKITKPIIPRQNIRFSGEDIKINSLVIPFGHRLGIAELPLIASLGISNIKVFRKLRTVIFSIGDELQYLNKKLDIGQIYDINRLMLSFMLKKLGCEVIDLEIIPDNKELLHEALIQADNKADIIISTGGVSVGDTDHTRSVLEKIGKIKFSRIAIKPGKPFVFGQLTNSWFCGLPGNPVSAAVTFYQLVQPAILKLSGQIDISLGIRQRAIAVDKIVKKSGRVEFHRGICKANIEGILEVKSTGNQGSHIFSSFMLANCFIILQSDRVTVEPGEWVDIEFFNKLMES
ncbi:molybdopterin molybdotransferase MoeA [Candidatus Ishikawella capsulata]|uniref:Molybdopterin molybdenumtransferase n=1 Tax=Candidatus Ishikawaella capsulata Mpkobe TaxID=476281 RepID=C5WCX8_9ENTR|nr:molybdopterin molybdotransferase MoeA [Candidatus Ishikawaella capsulata]BAH83184.1 molybdopterin biosynthesis protein [Candidatus Ishikawaella capsulata Mpkobe]